MQTLLRFSILLALVLGLAVPTANAQLSYAQTNYAVPGDTQLVGIDNTTATLSAGSGGSGQTWDFSALSVDDSTAVQVTDGSGTPYSGSFSDAELVIQINTLYIYQATDADTLNDLGLGIEIELGGTTFDRAVRYSEPFKSLVFPVEENDTWTDQASFRVGATGSEVDFALFDSVRWTRTTDRDVSVDGSGTLYLPNDTIMDVIRVRAYDTHEDVFESKAAFGGWTELNFGPVTSPSFDTTITYTYYSSDFKLPVMTYTIGLDDSVGDGGISFYHIPRQGPVADVSADKLTGVRVFPNPVENGEIHIELRESLPGTTELQLFGLDGRVVYRQRFNNLSTDRVDCTPGELAKGVYMLRLTNPKGRFNQRVVVR